jgi:hypothetical protein
MSEFTMMSGKAGLSWPVAYAAFIVGAAVIGWFTFQALKAIEARQATRALESRGSQR